MRKIFLRVLFISSLIFSMAAILSLTACSQQRVVHLGDWNPNKEAIISDMPFLATQIALTNCMIKINLWRNYEDPLQGVITIRSPLGSQDIPESWVIEDEICITHDGHTWETAFTSKRLESIGWICNINGGPKWATETTASVTFKISASYLTALEKVDRIYQLTFNNVPIDRVS